MTSIPSWAVKGAKVVCIHDGWNTPNNKIGDPSDLLTFPIKDADYTIREIRVRFVPEWGEVLVGLVLEEVVNPIAGGGSAAGEEMAFDVRSFKPLVSRSIEQDVAAHFGHHLHQRMPETA